MSGPRSPVSEFVTRINRSRSAHSDDAEEPASPGPLSFPRGQQASFNLSNGIKLALVKSSEVARKIGSLSVPSSPNEESERPAWPRERSMSLSPPILSPIIDKSLPDLPAQLAEAYALANRDPNANKGYFEKFLNKIGDATDARTQTPGLLMSTINPIALLQQSGPVADAVHVGINTFLDGMPVLMKALDEVSKLHPFVGVVVLAFKAVYTLEIKRRENDQKIIALYVEMKDMVSVLLQLRDVKDVNQVAPDGQTIRGRLQELSLTTAEDIKACSNVCDAYSKKKLIVKIISGPLWEGRLLDYVALFTARKEEFHFALSVNTAAGVSAANSKLDNVEAMAQEMQKKMEVMYHMFHNFMSPEQQEVETFIQSRGGPICIKNEETLKELIEYEAKVSGNDGAEYSVHVQNDAEEFQELKRELEETPEAAIKKNSKLFERKFEIQKRQVQEEVAKAMKRESDRIISALNAGPHEKLVDSEMYEMWKYMSWRGSVKAKHFVPAIRDYYREKASSEDNSAFPDQWTLQYISLNRSQPIIEAIDADESGHITVPELNDFTRTRPADWSLPRWISYWSVGWQMTVTDYCSKIEQVLSAIFHLRDQVKPLNRHKVDDYLLTIWDSVMTLTHSVQKYDGPEGPKMRFDSYVKAEEERLRANLEEIHYQIDDFATVSLVTGPGRIEIFILPLLYLILKRHLEIINIGRTYVLAPEELDEASNTWLCISQVASDRVSHLQETFQLRGLDIKAHFRIFACGMFSHLFEFGFKFNVDKIRELPDPPTPNTDLKLDETSDSAKVLNHPLASTGDDYNYSAYEPVPDIMPDEQEGAGTILGTWYCFLYVGSAAFFPMMRFTIYRRESAEDEFFAEGTQVMGGHTDPYTLHGRTAVESDLAMDVDFEINYSGGGKFIILEGAMDMIEGSVEGTWNFSDESVVGDFVMKRSPDHLRYRPSPSVIRESPARARWSFACAAVLHTVKKNSCTWSYFMGRFRDRNRYLELAKGISHNEKSAEHADYAELTDIHRRLDPAEVQFCASIIRKGVRQPLPTVVHGNLACNGCDEALGDVRIICMDCNGSTTVDLCDRSGCSSIVIDVEKRGDLQRPHLPTHDTFKTRTILHGRYHGMVERKAKATLAAAREIFADLNRGSLNGPKPACISCQQYVSQPCWACVDCHERIFVCPDCDSTKTKFPTPHKSSHTVVRCQPRIRDLTTEERLQAMEQRLSVMESRLSAVVERSSRMEETLQTIAVKNGSGLQLVRGVGEKAKPNPLKTLAGLLLRY